MKDLASQAIKAALSGNWKLAERLNKKILASESSDVEALNRLARAQMELGKLKEAQKVYKKVLSLDRYNSIASRGLERLKKRRVKDTSPQSLGTAFLEEPGKTKTVSLIHLGDEKVRAQLDSGEEVELAPKRHRISVNTLGGKYIGRLPDDLTSRLLKFIKAGNKYQALVKSTDQDQVKIFIRETERNEKFTNVPSFPQSEKAGYVAFTPPGLIHEEPPKVSSLEEEDQET